MDVGIANAVGNKNLLRFLFNGHWRTVEPHAYGRGIKGGDKLSGWQTRGKPQDAPGWWSSMCSEVSELQSLPATFSGPRQGYNRHDPMFRAIYPKSEDGREFGGCRPSNAIRRFL
jgi:hypothetical protein